jgi:hypothetical protein
MRPALVSCVRFPAKPSRGPGPHSAFIGRAGASKCDPGPHAQAAQRDTRQEAPCAIGQVPAGPEDPTNAN